MSPAASCTGTLEAPTSQNRTKQCWVPSLDLGPGSTWAQLPPRVVFPDGATVPSPHRYLINFLLDATVGMLLIYMGVRAVSVLVEWQQWESLRFGEYGNVPRTLARAVEGASWRGLCSLPRTALQASGFEEVSRAGDFVLCVVERLVLEPELQPAATCPRQVGACFAA